MSMWPENVGIKEQKQAKMENFDKDHQDPLEDVKFDEKPVSVDFQRLVEMAESGKGQSHMRWFMKQWERKRASALQALEEDLDPLCQERKDDQEPMKDAEHESISYWKERAMQLEERIYQEHGIDVECDISSFWKERVMRLEEKLQACLQKKHALVEKPEGSIRNPPSHTLKDKFSGLLRRADFFLHLVLQSAPVIIAHQDAELRYRFIFNHYPTLGDDEVI
nr:unnamed protein product [Digitaria exilis]